MELEITVPGPPKPGVERKANRRERRDWIRQSPRAVRLAYGFGQWFRAPGGVFIPPAAPR